MNIKKNNYFFPEISIGIALYDRVSAFVKDIVYDRFVIYQNDDLFSYFERWLYSHYRISGGSAEAYIGEGSSNTIPSGSNTTIPTQQVNYRKTEGSFTIKYHGKKIKIYKERQRLQAAQYSTTTIFFNQYNIEGIEAKQEIKSMINEAMEYGLKERNKTHLSIYGNHSDGGWNKISDLRTRPIESIILPDDIKKDLVTDAKMFADSRQWYIERSIPYTRTYLFVGPPGNGKTTMAIGLATEYAKSIYSLDLGSLYNDQSLRQAFSDVPNDAILLIEDIDSFVSNREIVTENKITFSGLINAMNGVALKEGLVTIITTNHPENLDPALTRKGRVDKTYLIPNPTIEQIEKYVKRFFSEIRSTTLGVIDSNLSMAQVQDICITHKDSMINAILAINNPNGITFNEIGI